MAYQTPITIKTAIDNIQRKNYVLPSIQREFIWKPSQIEMLFDSLMRDYPIGTFLFWKVYKTQIQKFQFYGFLREYHELNSTHNPRADLSDNQDVLAFLDGQQRMTSLYLGLCGSYAYKNRYVARNNPNAYPERKLYINLLNPSDTLEVEYDFKFLTHNEILEFDENFFWFPCDKIMNFKELTNVTSFLINNDLTNTSIHDKSQCDFANKTLSRLFSVIHQKGTISYYLDESEELDKVLQIFIRINSGGTKLSYSDLLLSIATAQWRERDARVVIHKFVDNINNIGDGFAFSKDFVLKTCLVLADLDVQFKVDNFNAKNMEIIEEQWEGISQSLMCAVRLIEKFGFNEKNLTATNAIIPIAYFIYKNEYEKQILHSGHRENDRKAIKEWLARVLLKGTFGGVPDSVYPGMRNLINKYSGHFPLKETIAFYKGRRKSISFSSDEINNLLELQYGKSTTYCILSLIYDALNNIKYHQDHIHPKSKFHRRNMKINGFSEEDIESFNAEVNGLANLQLLEGTNNIEKKDMPFNEWLTQECPNQARKEAYLRLNYINRNQSLEFKDFMSFITTRKNNLRKKLISILGDDSEKKDNN